MFEYDPRYYRKARLSPGSSLKAKEFRPDDFSPPGEYESPGAAASALPHQPEFEDFGRRQPDFEPEVDPDRDLPSLDDLFKPFELDQENKSQDEPYEDLCSPEVETFQYEDLDTRPPEVIHTLATAREEAASLVKAAQNQAEELMKKARNEAAALIASLKRREEEKQAAAREAIENLRQNVRERLTEAEAAAAAAENERLEAEKREAEAERRLAEAADRLAGLGEERKRLEE